MLTDPEQNALDAFLYHKSKSGAAKALGLAESTIRAALKRVERKGLAPWLSGAITPDHLSVAKTTVQYGPDGEVQREWKRLLPNAEAMTDFVDSLCERAEGTLKIAPAPKVTRQRKDVLAEICCFDAHIGMYAEAGETNSQNYDSDIAVKRIHNTTDALLCRMNNPEHIVVTFGGDMLHADTRSNKTEMSGNVLDVDSRYHMVVEKAVTACYDVVAMASEVAEKVTVVILEGNHSWHSEVWLAQVLRAAYSQCDRVEVVMQRSARKHMVWGDNLLVWTHGDSVAMTKWQGIISTEFAQLWGQTKWRHLKMGHVHHKNARNGKSLVTSDQNGGWVENHGLLVEYLPALSATDAWHASKGFIGSQQAMTGFEYHKKQGLITRLYEPAH
tara:strand:- start:2017 stop:3174 length:1158 start_codon:yes stop_codon:yes gene_type:complete